MKTPPICCSWLYVTFLCVMTLFCLVSSQCLESHKSLLLQVKNNFEFIPFGKLATWSNQSDQDCCFWSGVACDPSGNVTGLDLSTESISPRSSNWTSLFDLESLEALDLAYNMFNTTIPRELSRLERLKFLNLSNAGFFGQVPIEISRMTRLVSLDLSNSKYTNGAASSLKLENPNFPMLIDNLSELTELRLDAINLSSNRYDWCHVLSSSVPKLRSLSFSSCSLSGPIDSSLLNLESLSVIRLDHNNFSAPAPDFLAGFLNMTVLSLRSSGLSGEFPKHIFKISTLQTIDLSDNEKLEGFLPEFHDHDHDHGSSLETLRLRNTRFSGTLPDSISYLQMLSTLELRGCKFSGSIPRSIGNLVRLVHLDLYSNRFNGSLPSLSMCKDLIDIGLGQNRLSGENPHDWEGLHNLENLDLGNNSLSGSIPEFLFSLPSLQILDLQNNKFSGGLRVSNVSSSSSSSSSHPLYYVDLSSNLLRGALPVSLFDLRGLEVLSVSFNNFSGSLQLDDVLQQLVNLSIIDLSYNSLLVDVKDSILPFPQLSILKLASCELSSFPEFLKNQSMLAFLDLSVNQIRGSIPSWIWEIGLLRLNLSFNSLTSLDSPIPSGSPLIYLDLHSNKLQGPMPNLPESATYLDYSGNDFSSTIPSDIGSFMYFSGFFSLSNNNIHGSIPASICNASFLQVLDLSNNSLTGSIPNCLMSMMSGTLGVVNLRKNNLSGSIDDSFAKSCSLETLDLSENQLHGKVPKSLNNCKSLEVLNLGSNRMRDTFPCHMKNGASSSSSSSSLRVLVLRSNQFYGHIGCPNSSGTWEMLQIVDLSFNNFDGELPRDELKTWRAMMIRDHHEDEDEDGSKLEHIRFGILLNNWYYNDVVTISNKGMEMELVKILTVFTCIDLSSNRFEGPLTQELGGFSSLHVLNLSRNALSGEIPSALGKMSQLESLDLSFNDLNGAIPAELATLTFLSFLNLSHNRLEGKIPLGTQFQTFRASSFRDNLALCGPPLEGEPCAGPPSPSGHEHDSRDGLDLHIVYGGVLGFAFGSGAIVGGLLFTRRGSKWCDGLVDHIHFGVLHPLWFIRTLLDSCKTRRM